MSDLIRRLRQRAHLPEFAICGEAAAALEAAERERDARSVRPSRQAAKSTRHNPKGQVT
jgi:hypothetical protein